MNKEDLWDNKIVRLKGDFLQIKAVLDKNFEHYEQREGEEVHDYYGNIGAQKLGVIRLWEHFDRTTFGLPSKGPYDTTIVLHNCHKNEKAERREYQEKYDLAEARGELKTRGQEEAFESKNKLKSTRLAYQRQKSTIAHLLIAVLKLARENDWPVSVYTEGDQVLDELAGNSIKFPDLKKPNKVLK